MGLSTLRSPPQGQNETSSWKLQKQHDSALQLGTVRLALNVGIRPDERTLPASTVSDNSNARDFVTLGEVHGRACRACVLCTSHWHGGQPTRRARAFAWV